MCVLDKDYYLSVYLFIYFIQYHSFLLSLFFEVVRFPYKKLVLSYIRYVCVCVKISKDKKKYNSPPILFDTQIVVVSRLKLVQVVAQYFSTFDQLMCR